MDKSAEPRVKPSFSQGRRWGIGLQVCLVVLLVLAVVVMANYLSRDYFHRFHWSSRPQNELSPLTTRFVQSLTNHVKVILYYNRDEPSFGEVASLLDEYKFINHRIAIETVDYLRDAGAARRIKEQYRLVLPTSTNLVIFECGTNKFAVDGNELTRYRFEQVPDEKDRVFNKRAVAFEGEKRFTQALLAVTNPKPLNALFLEGHGEHSITNSELNGYRSLADVLAQNYVAARGISLLGTNVLADCNLLVIAGPRMALEQMELDKIDRYLSQGGRLLALFDFRSTDRPTGLEALLAKWGIEVGTKVIADPENSTDPEKLDDIKVGDLSRHPMMNPLLGSQLHLVRPRSVAAVHLRSQSTEAPRVEELAFSGEMAYPVGEPAARRKIPLMAAAERRDLKGVMASPTRMVVAGDSWFLDNQLIQSAANRDFAGYAINWLLDRTQLLEGLAPRPVKEYQVALTSAQMKDAQWILLAGMPGGVLVAGGLVWWRRRR